MAFKQSRTNGTIPSSPLEMVPLLTRREIPDVMTHQRGILDRYATDVVEESDVALQMPTGSGKTLVGLLIAEWRRRKFKERVVYLCPTRQLVNQTVSLAKTKYGIDVEEFTGSSKNYTPVTKSSYLTSEKIAITTYSSLFNLKPFFRNPSVIILDDAHAAESYIGEMWSIKIPINNGQKNTLHTSISSMIKDHISLQNYSRLVGNWKGISDDSWVEKLPSNVFEQLESQITKLLDTYSNDIEELRYKWPRLRDNLHACHLYFTSREILIRPLMPPTWTFEPFEGADQRIYMSATLGDGGDLERLTGREKITRISVPDEMNTPSVGRRFFMFPELSLTQVQCRKLRMELHKVSNRTVIIASNKRSISTIESQVKKNPKIIIYKSSEMEKSKEKFMNEQNAVAILLNRYDGLDFPNEGCRLLCLDGLQKATNTQEKFLLNKFGASILLNERMQSRILQAVGRCTRSLQDRAVVFVTGRDLSGYFVDNRNWRYFHPEIQAEIKFGVTQSKEMEIEDFVENFKHFFVSDADWEDANGQIVTDIATHTRSPYPGLVELETAVQHEIKYLKQLWRKNYNEAITEGKKIITILKSPDLRGYRALWHYLTGATYLKLDKGRNGNYKETAREQFVRARDAAPEITWLTELSQKKPMENGLSDANGSNDVIFQVENLENKLYGFGTIDDYKFEKFSKEVNDSLDNSKTFEQGQQKLGELLGFVSRNSNEDAAPDPWWICENSGIVFETHADANKTTILGANKARQANNHPNWLREAYSELRDVDIKAILVTPCTTASKGSRSSLKDVLYWPLDEFRLWSKNAIDSVRRLKQSLPPESDLNWRNQAAKELSKNNFTIAGIVDSLGTASDRMKFK